MNHDLLGNLNESMTHFSQAWGLLLYAPQAEAPEDAAALAEAKRLAEKAMNLIRPIRNRLQEAAEASAPQLRLVRKPD